MIRLIPETPAHIIELNSFSNSTRMGTTNILIVTVHHVTHLTVPGLLALAKKILSCTRCLAIHKYFRSLCSFLWLHYSWLLLLLYRRLSSWLQPEIYIL